ncbi:hypothetical protein [Nostoc sp.]|uniref:hypothetical protein n=1 Tax=Nostoc sp. TaxID=1180 RepID=UPI002FF7DC21
MSTTGYDARTQERVADKTRSKRSHAAGFTLLYETLRVACFPVGVRYRRRL